MKLRNMVITSVDFESNPSVSVEGCHPMGRDWARFSIKIGNDQIFLVGDTKEDILSGLQAITAEVARLIEEEE